MNRVQEQLKTKVTSASNRIMRTVPMIGSQEYRDLNRYVSMHAPKTKYKNIYEGNKCFKVCLFVC